MNRALILRWTLACTLGELIGFGLIPAAGGLLVFAATEGLEAAPRAVLLYAVAIVGGLGEGATLAWFQVRVLRQVLPGLDRARWIGSTAGAAAIAWALGMLGPTLDDLIGLDLATQIALSVVTSLVILASIGVAQSRVLRGVVEHPSRWIVANVVGWLAGLPWTFVLPALLPDDAPIWAFGLAFLVAGTLMGATMGAITGAFLVRLRPSRG